MKLTQMSERLDFTEFGHATLKNTISCAFDALKVIVQTL